MLATDRTTENRKHWRCLSSVRVFVAVLCSVPALAWAASAPNEDILKAAFVFNFAQFTRWPAVEENPTPIKFCLYGDSLSEEAGATLAGKVIEGRPTMIEMFAIDEIPAGCGVMYIAEEHGAERVCEIGMRAASQDILTVSDLDGFEACGGHITITTINNRLRFIVNLQRVQQSHLVLSAQLLDLAIIRNAPP